jgi:nucleoside-diphosphate-sugar epimerase
MFSPPHGGLFDGSSFGLPHGEPFSVSTIDRYNHDQSDFYQPKARMTKGTQAKSVSILGCGWLGLRLANYLISKGYGVKGSTTHKSKAEKLKQQSIEAHVVNLKPEVDAEDINRFLGSQTLVLNIPPRLRSMGDEFHLHQIQSLIPYIEPSSIESIIYISSTSVYPDSNQEVTEQDQTLDHPLIKAEELIKAIPAKNITILRPGGLIGEDRIPGKHIAGKKGITTGGTPVNYIHPVDLVRIIEQVIDQQAWNDTFNVVAPLHPTRRQVYTRNIEDFGFEPPEYGPDTADFKLINGDKITRKLGYEFQFPDPLAFEFSLPHSTR